MIVGLFSLLLLSVLAIALHLFWAKRDLQDLLYMTYHELRTDLTLIYGYGELLQLDQLTGDRKNQALQELTQAALHIEETLEALKRLQRREAHLESLELGTLIEKSVSEIQPLYKERIIHIQLKPNLKAIKVDPHLFRIALLNLLKNALQHSPKESVIEVSLYENRHGQTLEVRDFGKGIEKEHLSKIFKRLYTLHPKKGLGLGLYLVHQIATLHKGRVRVESEPRKGSLFSIEFAQ